MTNIDDMVEATKRSRHIRSKAGVYRYPPGAFDGTLSVLQNSKPNIVLDEFVGREIEVALIWTPPTADGRRWEEITGHTYHRRLVKLGFVDGLSGPTNRAPVVFGDVGADWEQPSTLALLSAGEPIAFGRLIRGLLAVPEWERAYGFPANSIRFKA